MKNVNDIKTMQPYSKTIQTEVGTLTLTYSGDPTDDLQVCLDGQAIAIPQSWTKQTSKTIARKVCNMIKMGQMEVSQYED